jgi:hypothetical protein
MTPVIRQCFLTSSYPLFFKGLELLVPQCAGRTVCLTAHQPGDTFLVNEKGRLKFLFKSSYSRNDACSCAGLSGVNGFVQSGRVTGRDVATDLSEGNVERTSPKHKTGIQDFPQPRDLALVRRVIWRLHAVRSDDWIVDWILSLRVDEGICP